MTLELLAGVLSLRVFPVRGNSGGVAEKNQALKRPRRLRFSTAKSASSFPSLGRFYGLLLKGQGLSLRKTNCSSARL